MTSHLGLMIVFAFCVSAVFGALLRDDPAAQRTLAIRTFLSLAIGALGLGWLMYFAFR